MQANFNLELPIEIENELRNRIIEIVKNTIGTIKHDSSFPEYMDKKQCAEYLNISRSTFDKWLKTQDIPFVLINGSYRFKRSEIDKFMVEKQK